MDHRSWIVLAFVTGLLLGSLATLAYFEPQIESLARQTRELQQAIAQLKGQN